jgi:hypothetical protein
MKSTAAFCLSLVVFAALGGCQRGEGDRAQTQAATPRPAVQAEVPGEVTKEYTEDISKLCNVIQLSGAPDDDAQTLTTANWLAANLVTKESRMFLISIQPLVGAAKADALDAEAKRVGLVGCPLSAIWRKPGAVPPA